MAAWLPYALDLRLAFRLGREVADRKLSSMGNGIVHIKIGVFVRSLDPVRQTQVAKAIGDGDDDASRGGGEADN